MAFTFDQIFAADPGTDGLVAKNASVLIFTPDDPDRMPLAIRRPDGTPMPNPVTTSDNGFGGVFVADIPRVAWAGGEFSGFFTSYDGMAAESAVNRAAAEAAAAAADASAAAAGNAQGAAETAAAAAAESAVTEMDAYLAETVVQINEARAAAEQAALLVEAPADEVTAALVGNPESLTGGALSAAIVSDTAPVRQRAYGLSIRNRAKLARWEAALQNAGTAPVYLTVAGHSIVQGVGSDDTSGGTSADPWGASRQNAWAVILRKLMSRAHGVPVAEGFIGLAPTFGYATLIGAPSRSQSLGPFGAFTGGSFGGYNANYAQGFTIPANKSGRFTNLDVLYWGADSGVTSPSIPRVLIDDVEKLAGNVAAGPGNLGKTAIAGLADSTHKIELVGLSTSNNYLFGVIARPSHGVVVNRIGAAGSTTQDGVGGAQTGAGRQRNIDALTLKGISNLVLLELDTNDHGQQIPLATFKANTQAIIDSAVSGGACVLLVGSPPALSADTTPIIEDEYRAAMADLSDSNDHVAYVDTRLLFGDRATAYTDGLFPTAGTVHPSRLGHEVMGKALFDALPLASV